MSISDIVSLSRDLVTLLAVVIGVIAGLFIFFQLAPVLALRISPSWTDETKQFLIIRYEVENKSRVRVHRLTGQVQMFEHTLRQGGFLSNVIPFSQKDYEDINYGKSMSEDRPAWHEPSPIFTTTKQIYPGETIIIEKLYSCTKADVAIHFGLQVGLRLGLWGRITTRKREPWRQTTTCIIVGRNSDKKTATNIGSRGQRLRR